MKDLTPEQIELIKETWEIPKQNPVDAGEAILVNFFTRYPKNLAYFDKFRNRTIDELKGTPKFRAHCTKIVGEFDASVNALGTDEQLEKLTEIWTTIGINHAKHHVPKSAFHELQTIILATLGELCELTEDQAEAWSDFLNIGYEVAFAELKC